MKTVGSYLSSVFVMQLLELDGEKEIRAGNSCIAISARGSPNFVLGSKWRLVLPFFVGKKPLVS